MTDVTCGLPNSSALQDVQVEQQLLGAILVNNDVFDRVACLLRSEYFTDPLHRSMYDVMVVSISGNKFISPVTLNSYLQHSDELKARGGTTFFERLAGVAISPDVAIDYAEIIRDLAVRRSLVRIGKELIDSAHDMVAGNELNNLVFRTQDELQKFSKLRAHNMGFVSFIRSASDAANWVNSVHYGVTQGGGLLTGLRDLDKQLRGLQPSDLIVLAGCPSMDGGALAANIAFNITNAFRDTAHSQDTEVITEGGVVGVFSFGTGSDQLAARVLSNVSKVSLEQIRRGELTDEQVDRFGKAAKLFEDLPLYIDDSPALHINEVTWRCRNLKRTRGLDLVIVDYSQMRRSAAKAGGDMTEISRGLKAIAKELNIPVLALSTVSEAVEKRKKKRPRLGDLHEFDAIEQDADVVMFLYREEFYHEQEKPCDDDKRFAKWVRKATLLRGKAEVIICKQRHGPTGNVKLVYESRFMRFSDLPHTQVSPGQY
jgi:replicative DNA helicase